MTAPLHHDTERWGTGPEARPLGATDAVVRVDTTTPCGTHLHLLATDAPSVPDPRTPGLESVGSVIQVGAAVTTLHVGDRLLVSCVSARGHHRSLPHRCRLVVGAEPESSVSSSTMPGRTSPSTSRQTSRAILRGPRREARREH